MVKLQGFFHRDIQQGHHDAAGPGLLKGTGKIEHPFSPRAIDACRGGPGPGPAGGPGPGTPP